MRAGVVRALVKPNPGDVAVNVRLEGHAEFHRRVSTNVQSCWRRRAWPNLIRIPIGRSRPKHGDEHEQKNPQNSLCDHESHSLVQDLQFAGSQNRGGLTRDAFERVRLPVPQGVGGWMSCNEPRRFLTSDTGYAGKDRSSPEQAMPVKP